ncbi:MAG: CobW-like GTP-binding protein [Erysipelotrichaceae bacterium]|nr:CobW-like GTP-binding protein [Erysipelotrichaceae bacterium]
MLNTIPTYVISGFLESGKTTFIKDTIASDDFFKKGKTLILSGEEGEVEYESSFLKHYNCEVYYFDKQEDFNALALQKIVNDVKPQRIVIELNGMWDLSLIEFPANFKIYQFINFINYVSFPIYFANMRQKYLDTIKQSDVVVFINVKDEQLDELDSYSSSFKLTNSAAQYMVMDENGQLKDAFKVVLPFDINAPIIKIKDDDYGIWYIDTFDHKENYQDKIVDMNVMVVKSSKLPKDSFVAGRLAMTCCSNDIQLYGHLCLNNLKIKLPDRCFIHLVAKVSFEYSKQYDEEECVLTALSIEKIAPLSNPVLDLTK